MSAYLVVEGHGEAGGAAHNLVLRTWELLALTKVHWAPALRLGFTTEEKTRHACEIVRSKPGVDFLLLLRDEDDGCPAELGPRAAGWLRAQNLPFPAAVVLAYREFESWFLPCADLLVGSGHERPGLVDGTRPHPDPERVRGAKEWLSRHMPRGRAYKPTLDQLPFTQRLDLTRLHAAAANNLSSFGTFERALRFWDAQRGQSRVYP